MDRLTERGPTAGRLGVLPPSTRSADAFGAALLLVLAGWMAVGAGDGAGDAAPIVWLLVGCATAFATGRWLTEREPLVVHRIVALGVAGAVVVTLPGVLQAGGAPLGYANANATLVSLAVLAALGVTVTEQEPRVRTAWLVVTSGLAAAEVATGSVAGILCLVVGVGLLTASALTRRPLAVLLGGAVVVMIVLGATVAIAHGADLASLGERAATRGQLWEAAAELTAEHPHRGVGPGGFEARNLVSHDADLRWAHHGYLQVSAEAGLVGLALVLALLGWAYARLGLAAIRNPHRAALGAAALTVVALHATVDHVLHHPVLVLTLALLVGSSTARPPQRVRAETLRSMEPAFER